MSNRAKKEKRLQKAGYITQKGQFGVIRMSGGGYKEYDYDELLVRYNLKDDESECKLGGWDVSIMESNSSPKVEGICKFICSKDKENNPLYDEIGDDDFNSVPYFEFKINGDNKYYIIINKILLNDWLKRKVYPTLNDPNVGNLIMGLLESLFQEKYQENNPTFIFSYKIGLDDSEDI